MGVSVVLDVVVGLVFVFFVFSLIASGVHEASTRILATRSKQLWRALGTLLDGEIRLAKGEDAAGARSRAAEIALGLNLSRDPRPTHGRPPTTNKEKLFAHELIRGLDEASNTNKTRLSHIDADLFSKALVDIVADGEQLSDTRAFQSALGELPDSSLKAELEALARHAGSDIRDLREAIGSWFDTRMDALSKAYKRRTKWWVFVIGIAVAIGFNVDAIHVTDRFYEDEALRAFVVTEAERLVDECSISDGDLGEACETKVRELNDVLDLPVWWEDSPDTTFWTFVGWMLAAAAIAQGAPFWFDVMRRLSGFKKSAMAT